ncbi:MAG TPA: hypothetical protein VFS00_20990 [Polyangiaceae bacterium]|nr:hypothetical protein [Polyangiaceae bacterium]
MRPGARPARRPLVAVALAAAGALAAALAPRASSAGPSGRPPAAKASASAGAPHASAWPLGSTGVSLAIAPPPAAHDLEAERLPAVDLSAVPGGTVALRKGLAWAAPEGEGRLVAVCLGVDGRSWSEGIEGLFFDRLNAAAKAELEGRGELERYEARPPAGDGSQFLQRYSASLREGPAERGRLRVLEPGAARPNVLRAEGVHAIVFAGARPDVLACSVACVEPDAAAAPRCAPTLESLRLEGPLVAPPHPGAAARAFGFVGRRPLATAGLGAGGLLMLLGLIAALWGGQKRSAPQGPVS